MSIPESDQWKLGGECNKCRRQQYCYTRCSANSKLTRQRILDAIKQKTGIDKIEQVIK